MTARLPAILFLMIGFIAVLLALVSNDASSAGLDIPGNVVWDSREVIVDGNIRIHSGGSLEVRGCEVMFDTGGERCGFVVGMGGTLRIVRSSGGNRTVLGSIGGSPAPFISASWADRIEICNLDLTGADAAAINLANIKGPVIQDCFFQSCYSPVYLNSCNDVIVSRCVFSDCDGNALSMQNVGGAHIAENVFLRAETGMHLHTSNGLDVRANRIDSWNCGVEAYSCEDAIFSGNVFTLTDGLGYLFHYCSMVTISNDNITTSGTAVHRTGISLKYSSFFTVDGCGLGGLRLGLDILNDVAVNRPFHIVQDSRFSSCELGIHIAAPNLTIVGCEFENGTVGIRIDELVSPRLRADPEGILLSGCRFDSIECGLQATNASDIRLVGCAFEACSAGVRMEGVLRATETGCTLRSWMDSAQEVFASELEVIGASLEDGPTAITADRGSVVVLTDCLVSRVGLSARIGGGTTARFHNTTHVRAYDVEPTSRLTVTWDVLVTVRMESGEEGGPARTSVFDVDGARVRDIVGRLYSQVLIDEIVEMWIADGLTDVRTPHRFSSSSGGSEGETSATIDRFLILIVVLDDVKPEVYVESPELWSTNASSVRFRGYAIDNLSEPVSINISVDGISLVMCEARWDTRATLADGRHLVEHVCTDARGNVVTASEWLLVDTIPPILLIREPPLASLVTNGREVRIMGAVQGHSTLTINDEVVRCDGNDFGSTWPLPEDGTYLFIIRAWDALGNTVGASVRVERDTVPPMMSLDEMPTMVREESYLVLGSVSKDCVWVRVAGSDADLMHDGRFTAIVPLVVGTNLVEIVAADSAGNSAVVALNVTRDISTYVRISSPSNGTLFQVEEVEIVIEAEPGCIVVMEGHGALDLDEAGMARVVVRILVDETVFVVSARDPLGNIDQDQVTLLYRPPPPIVQRAPGWPVWVTICTILVLPVLILAYGRARTAPPPRPRKPGSEAV